MMDGRQDSAPNSLMVDTQLDDFEMVEEHCSVLIAELGTAKAKVDQAEQSLAKKVLPAFQMLVARHTEAVQQLDAQRREAKAELEAAQRNFLAEKEALLLESKLARQRLAQERDAVLEEKEKLGRELATLRASRDEDEHHAAEKLLSLERKHQEERQRLTAAWEAEKAGTAALSKKLSSLKRENHALRRQHGALLEAGVKASPLSRVLNSLSSQEKGLGGSGKGESPRRSAAQVQSTQGSVRSGNRPASSAKQASSKLNLPVFASPKLQQARGVLRQEESGAPKEAELRQAAAVLLGGWDFKTGGPRQGGSKGEGANPGGRLEAGFGTGFAVVDMENEPLGSTSGEKRPRPDLPEAPQEASGNPEKKKKVSGSDRCGEAFPPGYKRRKQVGDSADAPLAVQSVEEANPGCPISSMETLLLVRGRGGVLTLEEREAMWGDGEFPSQQSGSKDGLNALQGSGGPEERPEAVPAQSARHPALRVASRNTIDEGARSGGEGQDGTSSASGSGAAKRDRSQLVSTLNRQRRALAEGGSGRAGSEDGLVGTPLVSMEPRVLEARDQNERTGAREAKTATSEGGVQRVGGSGAGVGLGYWQPVEAQAVSEGAVRDRVADSDTDEGEVSSPKRRRRAQSAGAVRPTGPNRKRERDSESQQTPDLGLGLDLDGGEKAHSRQRDSIEAEEAFELGRHAARAENRAVSVERSDGLPRGEKGRWVTAREGKAEQPGRKEGPSRMVQTRLSQPTRKDAPFFKAPTSVAPVVNEGGGKKWREATRGLEDDFLSTPMEKAMAGRNGPGGESPRVRPTEAALSGGVRKHVQSGRNGMARDLGTGSGERRGDTRGWAEERARGTADDSEKVSDSEKENSQPEEEAEAANEARLARLDGAGPRDVEPGAGLGGLREGVGLGGEPPRHRGIQVIKPGTYQHTAAERGRQLAVGEAPAYRYNAVVRKKDEREQLHAMDCANCRKFYEAVEALDAEAMERHVNSRCQKHLDVAGRHRYQYAPPATPSEFWNIGFDTETQAAS